MKQLTLAVFLIAASLVAQQALNNDSILKLVKSGIGDDLVVSMVQSQPGKYSLSPDDVVKLKQAGVSEKIITAMTKKTDVAETSGEVIKIQAKTAVPLAVENALSSKDANAGDKFKLAAAEDVSVDGSVVIAKGAPASGRVISAEKKSFATHNGKLEIEVDSVEAVDGHNIPVDGRLSVGGGGVGFGRTGKEAEIEKGKVINAVVTEGTEVKIKAH
jgi:hypothetical protein